MRVSSFFIRTRIFGVQVSFMTLCRRVAYLGRRDDRRFGSCVFTPTRLERRRLCSGRGLGRARPPQDGSRLDCFRRSRAGESLPPLSGSRLVHVAKHVFSAPRAQPVVGVRRLGCWLVLLDPLRQRHCASDTGGRTSCERKRQSLYLERTSRPCVAEWQAFAPWTLVCELVSSGEVPHVPMSPSGRHCAYVTLVNAAFASGEVTATSP